MRDLSNHICRRRCLLAPALALALAIFLAPAAGLLAVLVRLVVAAAVELTRKAEVFPPQLEHRVGKPFDWYPSSVHLQRASGGGVCMSGKHGEVWRKEATKIDYVAGRCQDGVPFW